MHRISSNNPVRRRLFAAEDLSDEARIDNFANILQETAAREKMEKMHKWNFDFENEIPLEGTYEWYPCSGKRDWIGVEVTKLDDIKANEGDSFLPMRFRNELTPKIDKGENAPLIRKRRKEGIDKVIKDRRTKRKISFD